MEIDSCWKFAVCALLMVVVSSSDTLTYRISPPPALAIRPLLLTVAAGTTGISPRTLRLDMPSYVVSKAVVRARPCAHKRVLAVEIA
eukprot:scaffold115156_cov24-Tisochrysis_lutea.AAC.4